MYEILRRVEMADGSIIRLDIHSPLIARKGKPGQFVIIRVNEQGERIPLTIADCDAYSGVITIIFQVVGKTTALLRGYKAGDYIKDVVGPLGKPAEIEKVGTVIVVGGGTGIAILHHVTKAVKAAGNYTIGILGARSKEYNIMHEQMQNLCDEMIITTDDGSYGLQGFVTDALKKYLDERDDVKLVYAIGPIIMMKNVCKLTKQYNIETKVSLNPIMIDGTGMCGGCRVGIGGKTQFCCIDGPDFDGHQVDFDELEKRNMMYLKKEKDALLYSIR
ncbi:MAG: sulfide/dihydroorotate dehydrogenase-like FAD/NAD-binding protein [Candidatus Cloacimonadaceae bacterium]|nr:sulfide/dihydroorotate dehydrogenase-like FAD/NAD-binding protein [Candidatus Cloacimonadaceae bacterium]